MFIDIKFSYLFTKKYMINNPKRLDLSFSTIFTCFYLDFNKIFK